MNILADITSKTMEPDNVTIRHGVQISLDFVRGLNADILVPISSSNTQIITAIEMQAKQIVEERFGEIFEGGDIIKVYNGPA